MAAVDGVESGASLTPPAAPALPARWSLLLLVTLAVLPFLGGLGQYYYIDDGLTVLLARRAVEGGWSNALGFGFNGHFRPLPQLSFAAVYLLFGPESPVPYHALALPLHALNTLLAWAVLRKFLGSSGSFLALASAAVFAVHWYATEAVTYVSALGALWSMAGGLAACLGALTWRDGWPGRGSALLVAGLLAALGGGEYGVACAPLVVACAFRPGQGGWRPWQTAGICAVAGGLLAGYVAFETQFANRGRLGSLYRPGLHVLVHLKDNVARIVFPSGWLGMDACFALLAAAAAVGLFLPPVRRRLTSGPAPGLLAGGVGALLPFAPSLAGNYGRFLYIATPFLACWLLLLLDGYAELLRADGPARRRLVVAGVAFLAVANFIQLEKRIVRTAAWGEPARALLSRLRRVRQECPQAAVTLWLPQPDYMACNSLCRALEVLPAERVRCGRPGGWPPAQEVWVVCEDCPPPTARIDWRFGEGIPAGGR